MSKNSVLIVYTGGTIGMIHDSESGELRPFDFDHLTQHVTELKHFDFGIESIEFEEPIDSSDMDRESWKKIGHIIKDNYEQFDGFVILHGSDTMAYSASALSFMFENLNKPVIFTGSQLPIGTIRTDGKENLITAIEIAAAKKDNQPIVPEVAVYFEYKLYRGNRTTKVSANQFDAFRSHNYPILASSGVEIDYNFNAIRSITDQPLIFHEEISENLAVLKIFPGIRKETVEGILSIPELQGVILETFGAGNGPTKEWFIDALKKAIDSGITILNVTQCHTGFVEHGKYETSSGFDKIGVINGLDMTTAAGLAKLGHLLSADLSVKEIRKNFSRSLRGEVSIKEGDLRNIKN